MVYTPSRGAGRVPLPRSRTTDPIGNTSGSAAATPVRTFIPDAVFPCRQYAETVTSSTGMSGLDASGASAHAAASSISVDAPQLFGRMEKEEQEASQLDLNQPFLAARSRISHGRRTTPSVPV